MSWGRFFGVALCLLSVALVIGSAVAIVAWVQSTRDTSYPSHPAQQRPGHVSENDIPPGVTALHVSIDGRRIPCIVYEADQAAGNGAGAGGISCDWSKP